MKKIILITLGIGLTIALAPYIILILMAILTPGLLILGSLYLCIKMIFEPFKIF